MELKNSKYEVLMDCPRDKTALETKIDRGIEIDQCPSCDGKWLDQHELDLLEDTVFVTELKKGTRMYAIRESDINCVKCNAKMATFNYRAYNLPVDYCTDQHGFWLDGGEDKEILNLMKKWVGDLKRSKSAEKAWNKNLLGVAGGKSIFERIKDLFK